MATVVTRVGKGSALTHTEMDSNFTNLNTDKAELGGATFTGTVTTNGILNIGSTFQIGGVAVTSTASELNALDGITSTVSELNILDGVTSTASELNILDGVTSTASELNILDGVTATTAELNYVDGVTSNIQTQLDGKAPSFRGCLVYPSSSQSLLDVTSTAIPFDSEVFDTDSIHSTSFNNTRLTVPSGVTKVRITGQGSVVTFFSGRATLAITKNGSSTYFGMPRGDTPVTVGTISLNASSLLSVSGGDYFQLVLYQNTGVTAGTVGAGWYDWFSMEIIE